MSLSGRSFANAFMLLVTLAVTIAGCQRSDGTSRPEPDRFGTPPADAVEAVPVQGLDANLVGERVAVQGTVVEQCPSVGCWFQIDDGTGKVLVDLNAGGWRVQSDRTGRQVRVVGRLSRSGKQYRIEAEYVEFAGEADDRAQGEP